MTTWKATRTRAATSAAALYALWPQQTRAMQLLGLGPDWQSAHEPVDELLFGGQSGGGKSLVLRATTPADAHPASSTSSSRPLNRRQPG
jgi:hypothetical protein